VDEAWRRFVQPFVARHVRHFAQRRRSDPNAYDLFLWSVAVVSAYSFELGDDRFQVGTLLTPLQALCFALLPEVVIDAPCLMRAASKHAPSGRGSRTTA